MSMKSSSFSSCPSEWRMKIHLRILKRDAGKSSWISRDLIQEKKRIFYEKLIKQVAWFTHWLLIEIIELFDSRKSPTYRFIFEVFFIISRGQVDWVYYSYFHIFTRFLIVRLKYFESCFVFNIKIISIYQLFFWIC